MSKSVYHIAPPGRVRLEKSVIRIYRPARIDLV
jgi:hypothetical protein